MKNKLMMTMMIAMMMTQTTMMMKMTQGLSLELPQGKGCTKGLALSSFSLFSMWEWNNKKVVVLVEE